MIEVRGVIDFEDNGHIVTDIVVTEHRPDKYRNHRMGVDVKPTKGKIQVFLGGVYGIPPGDIVWPEHIEV